MPDRVVVRHRLAPVREREFRIGGLRAPEGTRRAGILEVVERGQALEEIRLRGRGPGVLEGDDAHVLCRRVQRQTHDERRERGNEPEDSCARSPPDTNQMRTQADS